MESVALKYTISGNISFEDEWWHINLFYMNFNMSILNELSIKHILRIHWELGRYFF